MGGCDMMLFRKMLVELLLVLLLLSDGFGGS